MHNLRPKQIIFRAFVFFVIIAIDQLTKKIALANLLPITGGFLYSTCNKFIAWSIPIEGVWLFFLWLLAFLALLFIVHQYSWNVFLVVVVAGAVSNLIDRILLGCVVDFIAIGSFPVFNIADCAITVGFSVFAFQKIIKPALK